MSSTISHEENQFRMVMRNHWSNNNNNNFLDHFTWLCEIFACSCEINLAILLILQSIFLLWSISHNHAKFSDDHTNLQYFDFELPLIIFFIFLFWLYLNYLQIGSKSWSNYIASSSSSTLFVLFNLIHLFHHQFIKIILWNDSKTS